MISVKDSNGQWQTAGRLLSIGSPEFVWDGPRMNIRDLSFTVRDNPQSEGQRVFFGAHSSRELMECRMYTGSERIDLNAFVTGIGRERGREITYTLRVVDAPYMTSVFPMVYAG